MMKRIFAVLLTMMLAISVAACGSSEESAQETGQESTETKEEETADKDMQEETADAGAQEDDRNWSDSEIASYLAVPDSENIEVTEDTPDYFSFKVTGASQEDFDTYVGGCQYFGFSEDVTSSSDAFTASSEDGYRINVTFDAAEGSYSGSIEPAE